jgi:DNA polymerase-3 subunit beta
MDINGDKLIVTSSNPELGDAYEELSVVFEGEGLVLGFNARYILDVLEAMNSEKVVCEIKDSLSPVLFKEETSEDYKCVVMPLRI